MGVLPRSVKRKQGMNNSNLRTPLLLLIIFLAGLGVSYAIIESAPKPERKQEKKIARLVEVVELQRKSIRPQWLGGGEVSAAQRVQLSAQVSGKIESISKNAIPGAELKKGAVLAQIEQQEFLLQVQQQQAALTQAQASLDLEEGQAQLAKEEYELAINQISRSNNNTPSNNRFPNNSSSVNNGSDSDLLALSEESSALVLRKPQIASAKAGVKTAQANLGLAKLNLQRSHIAMPFNGQIISRMANVGSQVTPSNTLFDLVATNEFWLQVKVPTQFLSLLDTDKAVIIGQGTQQREAKILHSLIEVDAKDRQAKVLISIENPYGSEYDSKLLLGSYVECLLFAKPIDDVYVIENKFIKDDGSAWVVNDNKLYKRELIIAYQDRNKTWVKDGFLAGDKLLSSNIGVVTEGTVVRLAMDASALESEGIK